MNFLRALAVGAFLIANTAAFAQPLETGREYRAPYPRVWTLVLDYFTAEAIPVRNADEMEGVIESERRRMPGVSYARCGSNPAYDPIDRYSSVSVRLTQTDDVVRVEVLYEAEERRQNMYLFGFPSVKRCTSTGVLERNLLNYISRELAERGAF